MAIVPALRMVPPDPGGGGNRILPDDVGQGRGERLEPIRFVPPITLDKTNLSAFSGTCGNSVIRWWRRRESKSQEHVFGNPLMACDFWSKCLLEQRLPARLDVYRRALRSSEIAPRCGDIVETVGGGGFPPPVVSGGGLGTRSRIWRPLWAARHGPPPPPAGSKSFAREAMFDAGIVSTFRARNDDLRQ
jgi:hypothetical protein